MTRISQQQLESYLWGAATLLRGTIDAGDYKQFIFPLLFYKRLCDVFDEETQAALAESGGDADFAAYPENHRFQIPPEAHWQEMRQVAKDVGRTLHNALRAIETANPDKLYGIFGDAQWTNKERLTDALLRDLIEHFSGLELTLANLPEDELGQGYEYLIKKFADDSGHTAAEFYTNRTLVHLMSEMLAPQPGESVYDPTCGSGGMLLSCITHLRRHGQEWRNVRLYGQERNLMTSAIARMNCFLHGIEDFQIIRGDTLAHPKFVEVDRLQRFDVVLANPPYSIKQWNRQAFAADPWGRNRFGTPPQGRADYAFWQHILVSLSPETGRGAILFPHGVLFRQEEAEMRRKIIEADLIECVLGLGPNLFYNSAMEACVVVCRTNKSHAHKGAILFINALNEVSRERTQSFLTDDHLQRIISSFNAFKDEVGFAKVASLEQIRKNDYSLKIDLYVPPPPNICINNSSKKPSEFSAVFKAWSDSRIQVRDALTALLSELKSPNPQPGKMLVALNAIQKRFDRSKWTRVRFGDVVKCLKDSVDPNSGELERYVAGEHMDSENVHITRWGVVGDGYLGPAFIRRFRKGQVLYGSRRTYLKKVAFAEFDGITANTTFVLEAVEGKLYQPLLPWLMLSNRFTEHSTRESKGSTNPYINFPDIAKFEFALPPLDQQRRISEILWGMDKVIVSHLNLLKSVQIYKLSFFEEQFSTNSVSRVRLVDLCGKKGIRIGPFGSQLHAHEYINEGIPVVMPFNLDSDEILLGDLRRITQEKAEKLSVHKLHEGDVLLPRRGDLTKRGYVQGSQEGWICGTGTIRIRIDQQENRRLLFYALSRPSISKWLERNSVGTTMPNLNSKIIENIDINWPKDPIFAQRLVSEADSALKKLREYHSTTDIFLCNTINKLFEGP